MVTYNLALLNMMVIEYNQLINASYIKSAPPDIDCDSFNDLSSSIRSRDRDERDFQLEEIENEMILLLCYIKKRKRDEDVDKRSKVRGKRGKYNTSRPLFTNPSTGEREVFTYHFSMWYQNFVLNPNHTDKKWRKQFLDRFHMPYETYIELVEKCKNSHHFNQWLQGVHKYNHRENYPIDLLLLTSLRYLGRDWTFDDLQESTGIGSETIRTFFLKFIEFGSTSLYNKYVVTPRTSFQLKDCEHEFKIAGFPGCIGSTDATHIIIDKCPKRFCQLHLGYKLTCTARTYM